jgi:CelD/BcsL family acetyltransferase involved in cellulose biosynthesis
LSIISADEQPVAVHLGLRSGPVCHSWFPAYDPRFAAYSPGLILLLRLAESAPQAGITTIDLGSGGYEFKRTLTNRRVMTAAGAVELPSLAAAAARSRRLAKSLVRRTTIAPRVRRVARSLGGGSGEAR